MSEMDAEMAFLATQKAEYNPAGDYSAYDPERPGSAEEEEEEEYDPEPQPTRSPSANSASMPVSAADTPPEQHPTEEALKPQLSEAVAAAPSPQKLPRTKGGFVDESEDDEDEVPVTNAKAGTALLNAPGVSESPKRSATLSPSNAQNQQHNLPSFSVQNQGVPGVLPSAVAVPDSVSASAPVPNGSIPVPLSSTKHDHLNVASAHQSTVSVTNVSESLPKSRLPQDKIGILEDRIAEDPRGDTEAWLALIDEYRKRQKFDEARATYDDFFKVFPTAVRMVPSGDEFANMVRVSNGLSM
jgi:cleavage stimulation factor subunit 3